MVRILIFCIFLCGCTLEIRTPTYQDTQARADIAQIKNLLQQLGPIIDKAIDEKIAKEKK